MPKLENRLGKDSLTLSGELENETLCSVVLINRITIENSRLLGDFVIIGIGKF